MHRGLGWADSSKNENKESWEEEWFTGSLWFQQI